MSKDYNISYSYNLGKKPAPRTQAPATSSDSTLYAFDSCEEVGLQANAVLLVSKLRPKQGIVTRDVAIALNYCRSFRSLQQHAEYLTSTMPELGGDVAGVRVALEGVRDSGLMISAEEFRPLLSPEAHSAGEVAPSRVFIITCDRPQAVERLLESMLTAADLSRHAAIVLIDDSRDETNAQLNQTHVEAFNLHSAARIDYFGSVAREQLLQSLIDQLPRCEASLRFLIDQSKWRTQKTYGLSRTLCLLLSVGYRAIVLDDDVICSAIDSPHTSTGAQFIDGMCEVDFFASEEAWRKRYPPREQDPISGHLSCLGLGLGNALNKLELNHIDGELLSESQAQVLKRASPDSRILITQNGTLGDPGTEYSNWCYSLEGASLERLLRDPETLEAKLTTRQYWMGWSRPTFSTQATMSQVTGLDNTAILPPYFPAWRGEDQIFGAMVNFLFPGSFVLNYPWAVPHLPCEERTTELGQQTGLVGMGLVESFILENTPEDRGLSFSSRLSTLIQLLRNVSEKSDADLSSTYRTLLAVAQSNDTRQLSEQLRQAPEKHAPWRAALTAQSQRYFAALGRATVPVRFSGVAEDTPEEALWKYVRDYAGAFATCLEDWPAIREAAAAIVQGKG